MIKKNGFTLVEVSIAILILGMLLAGVSFYVENKNNHTKIAYTLEAAKKIEKVMYAHLLINGRLPCPASFDGNNEENEENEERGGDDECETTVGFLPTNTLDLEVRDGWGNPFFYQINDKATEENYNEDICHAATIFAGEGEDDDLPDGFGICTATKKAYCNGGCAAACSGGCYTPGESDDEIDDENPPFFHFSTSTQAQSGNGGVIGSATANPSGNIRILADCTGAGCTNKTVNSTSVAVVISFGSNGDKTWNAILNTAGNDDDDEVYKPCPVNLVAAGTINAEEYENCDGDSIVIASATKKIDDYVFWYDLFRVKSESASRGLLK